MKKKHENYFWEEKESVDVLCVAYDSGFCVLIYLSIETLRLTQIHNLCVLTGIQTLSLRALITNWWFPVIQHQRHLRKCKNTRYISLWLTQGFMVKIIILQSQHRKHYWIPYDQLFHYQKSTTSLNESVATTLLPIHFDCFFLTIGNKRLKNLYSCLPSVAHAQWPTLKGTTSPKLPPVAYNP